MLPQTVDSPDAYCAAQRIRVRLQSNYLVVLTRRGLRKHELPPGRIRKTIAVQPIRDLQIAHGVSPLPLPQPRVLRRTGGLAVQMRIIPRGYLNASLWLCS